jgi:hypothetical protein
MIEFVKYGKTPRLFRDIVITEKLDGTNSAIHIKENPDGEPFHMTSAHIERDDVQYEVAAQSRNRLIYPGKTTDNYGFAGWVYDNAHQLFDILGPGTHFGEWWGLGVARGYGMTHKKFSLFNTSKGVMDEDVGVGEIGTVPTLYEGEFSEDKILDQLHWLRDYGSVASPGFSNPEGICVYHTQSGQVYKVTLNNDDKGKWEA